MAQPWVMRYTLVNGQGNFWIDRWRPSGAAMRYTGLFNSPAMALMEDLDKETVDYIANYDETKKSLLYFLQNSLTFFVMVLLELR